MLQAQASLLADETPAPTLMRLFIEKLLWDSTITFSLFLVTCAQKGIAEQILSCYLPCIFHSSFQRFDASLSYGVELFCEVGLAVCGRFLSSSQAHNISIWCLSKPAQSVCPVWCDNCIHISLTQVLTGNLHCLDQLEHSDWQFIFIEKLCIFFLELGLQRWLSVGLLLPKPFISYKQNHSEF